MGEPGARAEAVVEARVVLTFRDARTAKAVAAALAVDNPATGLDQRVEGRTLVLRVRAAPPRSLRETLDDWIRCAAAAGAAAARGARP